MSAASRISALSRRRFLVGAAACLPVPGIAGIVYTPRELMEQYRRDVTPRLAIPGEEVRLYGGMAELQLHYLGGELRTPQYLLVIDRNPYVQAAMLFWRLQPGSCALVGAAPASTSAAANEDAHPAPGLFEQAGAGLWSCAGTCARGKQRVYDFGLQQPNRALAIRVDADLQVQVRSADRQAERRLGAPCADRCILLPASLISFLDEYGILDDGVERRAQRHLVPYRGRHLLLIDSEREERPAWSPAPPAESRRAVARRSE